MLLNDFFKISSSEKTEHKIVSRIFLNDSHRIYDGHFPGKPIVPGVCMMQMVKECVEKALDVKLKLIKASQVKFLMFIIPTEVNSVDVLTNYNYVNEQTLNISAELSRNGVVYFKIKGVYQIS